MKATKCWYGIVFDHMIQDDHIMIGRMNVPRYIESDWKFVTILIRNLNWEWSAFEIGVQMPAEKCLKLTVA